jgi:hypothetical protein
MKEKKPFPVKALIAYAIAFGVGAALVLTIISLRGVFAGLSPKETYRALSDAFVTGGLVLALSGVLVWLGNQGAFRFANYSVQRIGSKFFHNIQAGTQTYGEFVEQRKEKKPARWLFLPITGAIYFIVGIVLMVLFYQTPVSELAVLTF